MGRTVRKQVALYLDDDKAEALRALAERTGRTQQEILREALEALLARHGPEKKPPTRRRK